MQINKWKDSTLPALVVGAGWSNQPKFVNFRFYFVYLLWHCVLKAMWSQCDWCMGSFAYTVSIAC